MMARCTADQYKLPVYTLAPCVGRMPRATNEYSLIWLAQVICDHPLLILAPLMPGPHLKFQYCWAPLLGGAVHGTACAGDDCVRGHVHGGGHRLHLRLPGGLDSAIIIQCHCCSTIIVLAVLRSP